jgi:hypothetical protein
VVGATDWVLVPEVEELAAICAGAEDLLLTLAVAEEDSAEDPAPWVLPAPIRGRQALDTLHRVMAELRDTVDGLALPPVEPSDSTRPRLFSDERERVPLRAVQIAIGDRRMLAAAVGQLQLALSPAARRGIDNPWERKRLSDLAELLEQIEDSEQAATSSYGQPKRDGDTSVVQQLARLSGLLNLPPDDDTTLLVGIVRTSAESGADAHLTPSQTTAYGKTVTRLNTVLTGGDPLARWVY